MEACNHRGCGTIDIEDGVGAADVTMGVDEDVIPRMMLGSSKKKEKTATTSSRWWAQIMKTINCR